MIKDGYRCLIRDIELNGIPLNTYNFMEKILTLLNIIVFFCPLCPLCDLIIKIIKQIIPKTFFFHFDGCF